MTNITKMDDFCIYNTYNFRWGYKPLSLNMSSNNNDCCYIVPYAYHPGYGVYSLWFSVMDKFGNLVIDNNIFIDNLSIPNGDMSYFSMANAVDLIMLNNDYNDDGENTKYFMVLYSYVITEDQNGEAPQNLIAVTYSLSSINDNKYIINALNKYLLMPNFTTYAPWPNPICINILNDKDDNNLMAVTWKEENMFGQTWKITMDKY